MIRIAVVGAGAAGLAAACSAARLAASVPEKQIQVLLIEKNHHPGRKLLTTGLGQCNFTCIGPQLLTVSDRTGEVSRAVTATPAEAWIPPVRIGVLLEIASRKAAGQGKVSQEERAEIERLLSGYPTPQQRRFLRHSLFRFSNLDTLQFFTALGIEPVIRQDGKVFPRSLRAADLLAALIGECRALGVVFRSDSPVEAVRPLPDGRFSVSCGSGGSGLVSHAVILAAGGASYPKLGSDGSGFRIAKEMGHTITNLRPALCSVKVSGPLPPRLAGISFRTCPMRILREDRTAGTASGDLVITHSGFSGPLILDLSRDLRRGDRLSFDFSGRGAAFSAELASAAAKPGSRTAGTLIRSFGIPQRLIEEAAARAGLDLGKRQNELGRRDLQSFCRLITDWQFTLTSSGSFDQAMVTAGGIALDEISPETCESKLFPGMFAVGELLDIDGRTGGYNLQAAWTTGFAGGSAAAQRCLQAVSPIGDETAETLV